MSDPSESEHTPREEIESEDSANHLAATENAHAERGAATSASDTSDEVTVVVDVHEPDHIAPIVLSHPEVDGFKEASLPSADLVVNGVGIERKTPSDFAASMVQKRLDDQVERLLDGFEAAYILLEGDLDEVYTLSFGPPGNSIHGKIARVTAEGVPVIFTGSGVDSHDASVRLVDHAVKLGRKHSEPSSTFLPTGPVGLDEPPAKRMWGCLPGVGPALAERLYAEYGSPMRIAHVESSMRIEELTRIDGIGETTAKRLNRALWGQDDA